jgi:hypothetical protein
LPALALSSHSTLNGDHKTTRIAKSKKSSRRLASMTFLVESDNLYDNLSDLAVTF